MPNFTLWAFTSPRCLGAAGDAAVTATQQVESALVRCKRDDASWPVRKSRHSLIALAGPAEEPHNFFFPKCSSSPLHKAF